MNYASWIEEQNLKKCFIIATLLSTIAGTFTTGINLYDRVLEKRKQSRLDKGQDDKIRDLERRVDAAHGGNRPRRAQQHEPDLRDSLARGSSNIQREYEKGYADLGPRFAEGDVTTQLQLQSQIIHLQSTVIALLEEALQTGQPPDISKLYNASEFARQGTIRALRDQYRRMLEAPRDARPQRPGAIRRTSSTPSLRTSVPPSAVPSSYHRPQKQLTMTTGGPLFCRCAEELQRGRRVDDIIRGDVCPGCGALVSVDETWRIEKEFDGDLRMFVVGSRFVMKCHREGTGYACYLCSRYRDRDTLCREADSLVEHVAKMHYVDEYGDPDIKEVTRSLPYDR